MQHEQHILGHGQVHFLHAIHNLLLLFFRLIGQTFEVINLFFMDCIYASRSEENGDLGSGPLQTQGCHQTIENLAEFIVKNHD
jgi:hypothetical protein